MALLSIEDFGRLFTLAKTERSGVQSTLESCYRYVLPLHERRQPESTGGTDQPADVDELYDASGASAAQDLASEMLEDLWPSDGRPFTISAPRYAKIDGPMRERVKVALENRADVLIEEINASGGCGGGGWYQAAHSGLLDWTIAQGFISRHSGDAATSMRWTHMPLVHVLAAWPLRRDGYRLPRQHASAPRDHGHMARVHSRLGRPEPEDRGASGFFRDWDADGKEVWNTQVWCSAKQDGFIHQVTQSGIGSRPFVDFGYVRAGGETLCRGPVQIALPHLQVQNTFVANQLDMMDMALWGVWGVESDSINLENIKISPRSVITYEQGTKGIQRLDGGVNLQQADRFSMAQQANIRELIYGLDLGPTGTTPMSATEVMERKSRSGKRRAGPHSRLLNELLVQTALATNWQLENAGLLAPLEVQGVGRIEIGGPFARVRPLSPLTKLQMMDDVLRWSRFMEVLGGHLGAEVAAAATSIETVVPWLAERIGVPQSVHRTEDDLKKFQAVIAQRLQQSQASPAAGGPVAKAA